MASVPVAGGSAIDCRHFVGSGDGGALSATLRRHCGLPNVMPQASTARFRPVAAGHAGAVALSF